MSLSTSPQADDKDYRELSFWHENLPHSLAARPALQGDSRADVPRGDLFT